MTDPQAVAIPMVSGGLVDGGHLEELRTDPIGLLERIRSECGDAGRFDLSGRDVTVLSGAGPNEFFFRAPEEVLDQAEAPDEGGRPQPDQLPGHTVFETAPDCGSQQQDLQRFAGGLGGRLPEIVFQAAPHDCEHQRQPGTPAGQVIQRPVPSGQLQCAGQKTKRGRRTNSRE